MNCHAFLDLETLDTDPTAIVTEIACVIFDPDDFCIIEELAIDLDIPAQILLGRTISKDTIVHRRKNRTLPTRWTGDLPEHAVAQLDQLLTSHRPHTLWIWGKDFDGPILTSLFTDVGRSFGIHYGDRRCARDTYKLAFGSDQRGSKKAHHALDDCHVALRDLRNALITLNRTPEGRPIRDERTLVNRYAADTISGSGVPPQPVAGASCPASSEDSSEPPAKPFNPGITAAEALANATAFAKSLPNATPFAEPEPRTTYPED